MDISSKSGYPASRLSNFSPHPFVMDGVECASMEGFLQALKFTNPDIQVEVCKLFGGHAKKRGSRRNKHWKRMQVLWWQGVEYDRQGDEYQVLLDRAYSQLAKNQKFANALLATGNAVLTHAMGRRKPQETVLTTQEFCSRLTKERERLKR